MDDRNNELLLMIPDYKNNLDLEADEQIRVHYEELKYKSAQKYARKVGGSTRKQSDVQRKMFIDHVVKIENYSINGQKIETGQQLYDNPNATFSLVAEIIKAVEGGTEDQEELEKN